ncbi:metalloendoproteinase 2-MMP [Ziziphus jujuba]|uniref:Metalloendoproteinase 2-MMP n=2 Tax=Ziziphus jujuba TaxID=326968 RepID=A0A6P3ZHR5_ZIZJJ|nr:metalloendoproteinase 2-MMP [Ziziphus jujuba]KAH7532564.1 hypothetical protein FEM48_Zijuj04G0033800 [Ziziphus jujuba var. spinosa]
MASKGFSSITTIFTLLIIILLIPPQFQVVSSSKSSPFRFIKNLQGSQKGDHVKGLRHLKEYLERFGYLNHNNKTHKDDDYFDESLESAIETYQLNYNLNVTGDLDSETVSEMMVSRCGVADIVNGYSRMESGKKRPKNHVHAAGSSSSSLNTVGHYSFFPGMPRWPPNKFHLTYAFLYGTPFIAMPPVHRAFRAWAANTAFSFSLFQGFGGNGRRPDLTISFQRGSHGDGAPFDGPGGTLAHAFAPTDGRFHYDSDEEWTVGGVPGTYDLETVALHEIGHLLGLDHSSVPNAIMFPVIPAGQTKGLHNDDIQGIRYLYGYK